MDALVLAFWAVVGLVVASYLLADLWRFIKRLRAETSMRRRARALRRLRREYVRTYVPSHLKTGDGVTAWANLPKQSQFFDWEHERTYGSIGEVKSPTL